MDSTTNDQPVGGISASVTSPTIVTPPKPPYGGSPLTFTEITALKAQAEREGWAHVDLVAFDQMCNVMFLRGLPDETMSAHFQRMADNGNPFGKAMCAWLDVIQKRHGQGAQSGDLARAQAVEQTEETSLGLEPAT